MFINTSQNIIAVINALEFGKKIIWKKQIKKL